MSKKSKFKINVPKKSHIIIEWKDNPINYSNEAKKHIISLVSERYDVPKNQIRVNFVPVKYNENGEVIDVSTDVINNIQDPKFQIKLFGDYIKNNNIEGVDFEHIKTIDSEINSKIDYDVYDKYRKYELLWVECDYFLSYGEGVRFDFTKLKGLTQLNSNPENMGGKTNFAIDLPSFLFFGKTQKPYTLSECFNKYSDTNTFRVSGCVKVEGDDYIIERIVTRSKKRSGEWGDASQKVKYYKIVGSEKEELSETTENKQDEHSGKTNKIIKEAIGSEKDFKMIVSTTGSELDDLIDTGNTERGKLLSKWVGLSPLEEKDKLGKEKYKAIEKTFKSKLYNISDLEIEGLSCSENIEKDKNSIVLCEKRVVELDDLIKSEESTKETLLATKKQIDPEVLKLDITTINRKMEDIIKQADVKKQELERYNQEYAVVKDLTFDESDYKKAIAEDKEISLEINDIKNKINQLKTTNKNLQESEICPTCKRKYDNLDNTPQINENNNKIEVLTKEGVLKNEKLKIVKGNIDKLDLDRKNYDRKLKLESLIAIIPVQIENLRSDYREKQNQIKEYNQNKESIDLNNKIDINLTNVKAKISSYTIEKTNKIKEIEHYNRNIIDYNKKIESNNIIIQEIKKEQQIIKDWNVYLEMVGKNGISKMVLKNTLPIINSELSRLLDGVSDFDVEVVLTDKNEVVFKIIRDDIASDLGGASGFEKTVSALALRTVLGNISTMPRPNFIVLDEILGRTAKTNYESIRGLYEKIEGNYQFILHVCHLDEVKDWHKNIITISKVNNFSKIN